MARRRVYSMVYRPNQVMTAMAAAKGAEVAGRVAGQIPWWVWVGGAGLLAYGYYRMQKGVIDALTTMIDPKVWEKFGKESVEAAGKISRKVIDEGAATAKHGIKKTEETVKVGMDAANSVIKHGYINLKDLGVMIAADIATVMTLVRGEQSQAAQIAASEWEAYVQTQAQFRKSWQDVINRVEETKTLEVGEHIKRNDFLMVSKWSQQDKIFRLYNKPGYSIFDPINWGKVAEIYQRVLEKKLPMMFEDDIKMATAYEMADKYKAANLNDYEWAVQYLVPLTNKLMGENTRSWDLPLSGRGLALAIRMQVRVEDGTWKLVGTANQSLWEKDFTADRVVGRGGPKERAWVGWKNQHPLNLPRPENWPPADKMTTDLFWAYPKKTTTPQT